MPRLDPVLNTLRRTLLVPAMLPACLAAMGMAWLGALLAQASLGADEGLVEELRTASVIAAAMIVLSLAEPVQLLAESRSGLLVLRAARGGGPALVRRGLGLLLAVLPAALLASWAAGGWPSPRLPVVLDLVVLCGGALALGAFLERGLLVPALWLLLVAGHLRPWFGGSLWAAWLPRLGAMSGAEGVAQALLWSGGALLIASSRLRAALARG